MRPVQLLNERQGKNQNVLVAHPIRKNSIVRKWPELFFPFFFKVELTKWEQFLLNEIDLYMCVKSHPNEEWQALLGPKFRYVVSCAFHVVCPTAAISHSTPSIPLLLKLDSLSLLRLRLPLRGFINNFSAENLFFFFFLFRFFFSSLCSCTLRRGQSKEKCKDITPLSRLSPRFTSCFSSFFFTASFFPSHALREKEQDKIKGMRTHRLTEE